MLITMPNFDITTKYLYAWNERVIKVAENNAIKVVSIRGRNVTKSHIESDIKKNNPRFLYFNGHGTSKAIFGQNDEPLIVLGENDDLLKSKIVHSVTCDSGRGLGEKCKADSFIGYDSWFFLPMNEFSIMNPIKDEWAKPILESALEVPIQILKRKSTKEAFDKSQEKYQKWIDEFTISSSKHTTAEIQLVLPCLFWNNFWQKIHGKGDSVI